MSYTIAVAGKGGTGKTTLCALLLAELLQQGKGPILAIDADANANLGQVLGITVKQTVGSIREDVLGSINKVPAGMTKEDFLEYHIQSALIETDGFDLITMGRPEGPGCYCYANNLIRRIVDALSKNYAFMLIDNEAGLEHLSRRTTRNIDYLLLLADASFRGLETVGRIAELAREMKLNIARQGVIVSRLPQGVAQNHAQLVKEKWNLELLGIIPQNDDIQNQDIAGSPLIELPADCSARQIVRGIVDKMGI
ncbi:MAG: AAA family ATPase [Candidatus Schekmanbacteria bacterium]|nr:AAA family ATPase [Candidatus Schekmanbacteria bacterium]